MSNIVTLSIPKKLVDQVDLQRNETGESRSRAFTRIVQASLKKENTR